MNPLLYGPVRLSEVLGHPTGYFAALGFTGLVPICDLAAFPQQLLTLKSLEPTLTLIPELSFAGKPTTWGKPEWDTYWSTLGTALAAAKSVGATTVSFNAERESSPSQKVFWHGSGPDVKQRGKEFAAKVRTAGLLLAVDAIPSYEDPKYLDGGSKGEAFVPFLRGLAPDLMLYADQGELPKRVKQASARVCKALGATAAGPQIALTRQRFEPGQESSWNAFVSALKEARPLGAVCVAPENSGDVFSVLTAEQIERVRGGVEGVGTANDAKSGITRSLWYNPSTSRPLPEPRDGGR